MTALKKTDKQTPKCHEIRRKRFQLRMAIHKLSDSEWNPIFCGCDKVFIETLSKNTSFSEYSCRWVMLYLSLHDKKNLAIKSFKKINLLLA